MAKRKTEPEAEYTPAIIPAVDYDGDDDQPLYSGAEPELPIRTVNGQPIPEHLLFAIPYANTDQGIAEANEQRNRTATRVSVNPRDPAETRQKPTATELDKQIEERRDFRTQQMEPWEAPDPMKELADRFTPVGHRPHYVSPTKAQRDGMRGWVPVKGENGDPVKLGNLVLASMPEEKAQARNNFFAEKDRVRRAEINQNFSAKREELEVALGRSPGETHANRGPGGSLDGLRSAQGNTQILDE